MRKLFLCSKLDNNVGSLNKMVGAGATDNGRDLLLKCPRFEIGLLFRTCCALCHPACLDRLQRSLDTKRLEQL
ncbi:MAG: hypothetical protein E5X43_33390 [Mesorhizobium sp.]|nr:MAG: hypothetical protein E5X43_33390 [Mesorhizobium sp.]